MTELYEAAFARQFIEENKTSLDAGNIDDTILRWAAAKAGTVQAEIVVTKSRGDEPTKTMLENSNVSQYILTHINAITENARELLGINNPAGTVSDMTMAEYSANRKNLGVKDLVSYERSW